MIGLDTTHIFFSLQNVIVRERKRERGKERKRDKQGK